MGRKTLFISPHPDDAEIGAGMSLLDRLQSGTTIKSVVVTLGNKTDEYDRRRQELGSVQSNYRYTIQLLSWLPATLQQNLIQDLETMIAEFEPDEIFFPHKEDRHQDHEIVSRAVMIAARKIPNKYFYETPSTIKFLPNHYFVGNERLLEEKIKLISLFSTQAGKPYLDPSEIRALAQATGRRAMQYAPGRVYAEGFITNTIDFVQGYK